MTFKDCLLELGLDNAEEIAERVRQQPEDFGREADILLKKLSGHHVEVEQKAVQTPDVIHTLQAGSGFSLGF